ncbi:cytochrome b [Enterovirga rhinocerotis]|uniref:Cytochrome b561 n=1 Tax=Enterovirga rhinocerotis TaxID=1339210 RepID=A0A4R7C6B5_9HYPH|nr:cytochrome b [Enterovirga rhinocerotis]TDR93472.1 cytochrome b561 [Enterovirga rhinocerotis]
MNTAPASGTTSAGHGPRYSALAIAFHWTIAVLVLGLIASGWWMTGAIRDPQRQAVAYDVYQLHKAFGLCVLLLTLARLGWRLGHRPPPLPAHMRPIERFGAHAAHVALYALTLAVPLLGWAMVSASPLGLPTVPFGLFEWPHLPVLGPQDDPASVEAGFKLGHEVLAYSAAALVVLHVAAALKHHFVDHDGLLGRMLPFGGGAASS